MVILSISSALALSSIAIYAKRNQRESQNVLKYQIAREQERKERRKKNKITTCITSAKSIVSINENCTKIIHFAPFFSAAFGF